MTSYAWSCSLRVSPTPLDGVLSLLDWAARHGLRIAQLCENSGIHAFDEDERARVVERAKACGVELELGARARSAEELSGAITTARALGCRLLRVVAWSGGTSRVPLHSDRIAGMTRDVLPQLREAGMVLAIENYFDIDDGDLAAVVDGIDDELVGVCYDTANSTGLLRDPAATAALLAPRAASVHLKDFVVHKLDAGYRTAGVPLGRGWLDVRTTLAQISRSPRRPHVLLELWVEPEPDAEATARKESDWLAASLDYARHLLSEDTRPPSPQGPRGATGVRS